MQMGGVLAVCSQCAGVFHQVQGQLLRQIDFQKARIQQLELIVYKQTQQLAQTEIQFHQREPLPSTTSLPNFPTTISMETRQPASTITPLVNPQFQPTAIQPSNHSIPSSSLKTKELQTEYPNDKKDELHLKNLRQNGSHLPNEMLSDKAARTLQSKLSNRRYLL